jgi:hypothetical protein
MNNVSVFHFLTSTGNMIIILAYVNACKNSTVIKMADT